MTRVAIRETAQTDTEQLLALYPQVFPDEDLTGVVTALLDEPSGVLSLVGKSGNQNVAHVIFTLCYTGTDSATGALLGPLGVRPDHQGGGLGTEIVRAGFRRLDEMGVSKVFVLGDPGYYGRFGFETERRIQTPCPIPDEWTEVWQSVLLSKGDRMADGVLTVPKPWMNPALWSD